MQLTNKVALVTGAAHRVGKGIALKLASEGTSIIIHYGRSKDAAVKTKKEVEELGVEATVIQANLGEMEAVDILYNHTKDNFGKLDILVNSAATFVKKQFGEFDLSDWDKSINVNLRTPFFLTQQFTPLMKSSSPSSLVVNIADLSGVQAWNWFGTHSLSKAGIMQFTRFAARALAPEIRVNAIIPGPILPPAGITEDSPSWQATLNRLPLRKSGTPEQIGNTVVFFAKNDFITGELIAVDGGEGLVGPGNH